MSSLIQVLRINKLTALIKTENMSGIYLLVIIVVLLYQAVCGQGNLTFPGKTNLYYVKSGDDAVITCVLSPDTPSASSATYYWYDRSGNVITTTNSLDRIYIRDYSPGLRLHIDRIDDDDAGSYNCSAKVNQQTYKNTIQIRVKASVKFTNCIEQQTGVLGRLTRILCTASAGGVQVTTYWEKDGYSLSGTTGRYVVNSISLTILNVTEGDVGTYRYVAITQDDEQKVVEIYLDVLISPKIIAPILSSEAVVGNKSTLYCKASGKPRPTISWYKQGSNNELITTDRLIVKQNDDGGNAQGVLEIINVIKEDEAIYTCVAKNSASSDTDDASTSNKLTVLTPPTITDIPRAVGRAGAGLNLECNALGYPTPDMMWRKEGVGSQFTEGTYEDITVTRQTIANIDNPGAKLTMSFSKLKKTDAANYTCLATSRAGFMSKSVEMEVKFPPDFDAQDTTTFYTWLGNNADYNILCIATGNPLPVIRWWKDGVQIVIGTALYSIDTQQDTIANYRMISKLRVTYNGNTETVFGIYKCEAENNERSAAQNLTLRKGERPKKPVVTVKEYSANYFTFWLMETPVDGPEVKTFKLEFKVQGGSGAIRMQEVEKEYRTNIDEARKYTEMIVTDLIPSTAYVFTFYARSPVGDGDPEQVERTTTAISVPNVVDIKTAYNAPYTTVINVVWVQPMDGGSVILKYVIRFRQVEVKSNSMLDTTKGYELQSPLSEYTTIDNIKDTQYMLSKLTPGKYYQVEVTAVNNIGPSTPSTKIIKTKDDSSYVAGSIGGAPRSVSMFTIYVTFGCITAFFISKKFM